MDALVLSSMGRGWDIFPVKNKRPLIRWKEGACSSWTSWPQGADVAVATGARSGIVVVDDDREKNGLEPWIPPVPTATVRTASGGVHHYYRHPGDKIKNSVGRIAEHVDVRGDGGYVVVYDDPEGTMVELPKDIVEFSKVGRIKPIVMTKEEADRLDAMDSWTKAFCDLGPVGGRNAELFKRLCIAAENGMPRTLRLLLESAVAQGLSRDEVQATYESVMGRVQ